MISLTKQCGKCKQIKPVSEFSVRKKSKDGLQAWCLSCNADNMKHYNVENRYGITHDEKMQMVKDQNNCCAICHEEFKNTKGTHVDHHHTTGQVRSILCHSCNTGLGAFKDSVMLLERATEYLIKHYHARQNTTTPVPTGANQKGGPDAKRRALLAARLGEDRDDAHDYRGAVSGENTYRSAKEGC